MGGARPIKVFPKEPQGGTPLPETTVPKELAHLGQRIAQLRAFYTPLVAAGWGERYEAAHAKLALDFIAVVGKRCALLAEGKLQRLPEPSQTAADQSYLDTAIKLCEGLEKVLQTYAEADTPYKKRVFQLWTETGRWEPPLLLVSNGKKGGISKA